MMVICGSERKTKRKTRCSVGRLRLNEGIDCMIEGGRRERGEKDNRRVGSTWERMVIESEDKLRI